MWTLQEDKKLIYSFYHTNPIFIVILTTNNGLQEISDIYEEKKIRNKKTKNTAVHWPRKKRVGGIQLLFIHL